MKKSWIVLALLVLAGWGGFHSYVRYREANSEEAARLIDVWKEAGVIRSMNRTFEGSMESTKRNIESREVAVQSIENLIQTLDSAPQPRLPRLQAIVVKGMRNMQRIIRAEQALDRYMVSLTYRPPGNEYHDQSVARDMLFSNFADADVLTDRSILELCQYARSPEKALVFDGRTRMNESGSILQAKRRDGTIKDASIHLTNTAKECQQSENFYNTWAARAEKSEKDRKERPWGSAAGGKYPSGTQPANPDLPPLP
jgi:exonuclease III